MWQRSGAILRSSADFGQFTAERFIGSNWTQNQFDTTIKELLNCKSFNFKLRTTPKLQPFHYANICRKMASYCAPGVQWNEIESQLFGFDSSLESEMIFA
jgi:hypothetical protein